MSGVKLHLYGPAHLERLGEIRKLRAEGYSLGEIREHLGGGEPVRRRDEEVVGGGPGAPQGLRERILEAATLLFVHRGYQAVRMADIASQLRISKATLYQQFESKEELFIDCIERVRYTVVPLEVRRRSDDTKVEHASLARARTFLENFPAFRSLATLLGGLMYGKDPNLAARAREEYHDMVMDSEPMVRVAIERGIFRQMDSELVSYMLWGALVGAGDRMTKDDRYSLEEVVQAFLEFASIGLFERDGGSGSG